MAGEATLAPLRARIDAVDAEIVRLLARRMEIVDEVIAIKAHEGLPAALPARVEEVVARARHEAERSGVPADLVEILWRTMVDWVIAYEDTKLGEGRRP